MIESELTSPDLSTLMNIFSVSLFEDFFITFLENYSMYLIKIYILHVSSLTLITQESIPISLSSWWSKDHQEKKD